MAERTMAERRPRGDEDLTIKGFYHSVSGPGSEAARNGNKGDTVKDVALKVYATGAGIASAVTGYTFVSGSCETFKLEEEDKKVTKSSAKAGAVVGTVGAIGTAVAGTAVAGVGTPLIAVLFIPAAITISAGWLGHKLYQSSRGEK